MVLPEYAAAFDPRGVGLELAEPLDGPFVAALRAHAAGMVVLAGTVVPGDGRAVNTVVAVRDGALVGGYRKVHLYDAFGQRESDRLEPGPPDAPPLVVDVDGLAVGVLTCYDLRFPESARRLVDAGAQVVVVPAAWAAGPLKADHWLTLLRARAIESTAYVLGRADARPRGGRRPGGRRPGGRRARADRRRRAGRRPRPGPRGRGAPGEPVPAQPALRGGPALSSAQARPQADCTVYAAMLTAT